MQLQIIATLISMLDQVLRGMFLIVVSEMLDRSAERRMKSLIMEMMVMLCSVRDDSKMRTRMVKEVKLNGVIVMIEKRGGRKSRVFNNVQGTSNGEEREQRHLLPDREMHSS